MGLTRSDVRIVTPVLETNAYGAGDRLGAITEITSCTRGDEQSNSIIQSIAALTKNKKASAIDLMFFSDLPTVASADNAAIDISAAEMAAKHLGTIVLAAADWLAIANVSAQTVEPKRIMLKNTSTTASRSKTSIWMVLVDRTGGTYVADEFVFKFGLLQE